MPPKKNDACKHCNQHVIPLNGQWTHSKTGLTTAGEPPFIHFATPRRSEQKGNRSYISGVPNDV